MNSCLPALLLIVSLTIVGCGGEKSSSAHSNTLVFSRGSDAQKLDPADVDDGESVKTLNQICEGLLRFKSGTLELEPWLAESYSLSDDGLKITFKIREGIIFHDGTPVTAEAAAFSFLRQMDKEHPGHLPGAIFQYWTSLYSDIETVTVEGPMTLTMGLRQPNATILFSLAAFPAYLISPQSLVDYGQDMVRNPVGTGPYQFSSWEPNQAIILKKFDNYWGEPAGFERLVIKSVPENAVRLLDLKAGETQILDGLQPAEVQPLIEDPKFDVYHEPGMINMNRDFSIWVFDLLTASGRDAEYSSLLPWSRTNVRSLGSQSSSATSLLRESTKKKSWKIWTIDGTLKDYLFIIPA